MGLFDSAKKKAQDLAADHPDKVEQVSDQAIEKGGDAADGVTGGKYSDKIDRAEQAADDHVGEPSDTRGRSGTGDPSGPTDLNA